MTTIYLVRHGETDWNVERRIQGKTDIPLNENGLRQAEACAASLDKGDYDVVVSSNLQRARKTAEIINSHLNLPFEVMEDFAEWAFGDAEGLTFEERDRLFPDRNYPNQEGLEQFAERIMTGLDKVHSNYPDSRVLLVTHGGVIYRILSIITEGELNLGNKKIENTSISTISWEDEKWVMKDYNRIDHLEKVEERA